MHLLAAKPGGFVDHEKWIIDFIFKVKVNLCIY